jgi:hypothetical protein
MYGDLERTRRLVVGVVLCTACGSTPPREDAPRPAGGTDRRDGAASHPGGGYSSPLCSGAEWTSADEIVATAFSDLDVVLIAADGSLRVAYSFELPAGVVGAGPYKEITTGDGRVTASVSVPPFEETVRLDRAGNVIWHLGGIPETVSDVGFGRSLNGRPYVTKADGTAREVPLSGLDDRRPTASFGFQSPPDANGWMYAWWRTTDLHGGAINMDGVRVREFHSAPNDFSSFVQLVVGTKLVYLTDDGGTRGIAFATPDGSHFVPIDASNTDQVSFVPSPKGVPPGGVLTIRGSHATSVFWVDASSETLRGLDSSLQPLDLASGALMGPGTGDWFSFFSGTKLRLFQASSGASHSVELSQLAPLVPMLEEGYCGQGLTVYDDGRVGGVFHDDSTEAFYVSRADGSGWDRMGQRYASLPKGLNATRTVDTWTVAPSCAVGYPSGHAHPADDEREPALVYDTTQVIGPDASPLLFTAPDAVLPGPTVVDPTGKCVFHQDGQEDSSSAVYDLDSGTTTLLPSLTHFTWL